MQFGKVCNDFVLHSLLRRMCSYSYLLHYFLFISFSIIVGFISLLVLTAIGCGVQSFCRKNGSDDDIYSLGYGGTSSSYHRNDRWLIVATLVTCNSELKNYQNWLLKENLKWKWVNKAKNVGRILVYTGMKSLIKQYLCSLGADEAPCMNCLLIEMGEMVCYTPR